MSSHENISISAIDQVLAELPETFTVSDIQKRLGSRADGLARRLERLLDGDDRFFNAPGKPFHRREAFFKNFRFAVTFDGWELGQGFLIPGHRFSPVLHPEVFPSETTLLDGGRPVPRREITLPLGQAFHYHMLLGSDNIFDFLLAESPANAALRSGRTADEQVTLTVFDLSEFYRRSSACEGDAMICTVNDYEKGVLDIAFQPGSERSSSRRKAWELVFDEALTKVCERFEDYLDITEQLAWGLYYGGEVLRSPDCSIDEYIRLSAKMTIRAEGDHAVLALRNEEKNQDGETAGDDVSDILTLSKGETGSLQGILKELGNPVTLPEIDAYILDECFARESDFDAIFRRIFGSAENICADEAQQVYLATYLEERFEELHGNYNRADDELKAPLRSEILEGIDAKLEFFRLLSDVDADPEALDHEAMHRLAEIDLRLDEMLKLLDSPRYTPDAPELEKVASMVDSRLDEQQELIEKLSSKIKSRQ
ncbi:MAG: hypothetical protein IJU70_01965 [Lentisphaeria bacterium]|nr:hypothetical protein [Lentisphaeria bacterium]